MLRPLLPNPAVDQARVEALSKTRLRNYRTFFGATSDAEVLGLYQWNEDLSASLYRAITALEIVMRNSFHKALSQRFGVNGSADSRDWYEHLRLDAKSHASVQKVTHQRKHGQTVPRIPVPLPDDVVAGVTFGFWPHLLDAKDVNNRPVQWGPILLDVLPGNRQQQTNYWAALGHQDELFARIELCNKLRNRIAHHEPVWKLGPLITERRDRPGYQPPLLAPAPTTPEKALVRLRLLYDRIVELMSWFSPDTAASFIASEHHWRCLALLQPGALNSYRHARPMVIDLASERSFRAFRKVLRLAARKRHQVWLQDGGRTLGLLNDLIP